MDISELLQFVCKSGASDLHISTDEQPMVRLHGDMKRMNAPAVGRKECHDMITSIMDEEQRQRYKTNLELDFSMDLGNLARFRVNAYFQMRGPAAAFRVIPVEILSFEKLGLPKVFGSICGYERGLVLVTGPTGSGKSTTLAAMIDYINRTRQAHIITIEDPIEFVHKSKKCLINQREVGPHTRSFANALKSALREDPDIILVGEMRDLETIRLALTAAETGHLVFGTLHTCSALKTVDRIIDVFPTGEKETVRAMLAESLRAVISQALLKRKDGTGRCAAHEIMIAVPAVKNLIREQKIHQIPSIIQTGQKFGMQLIDQSLRELVRQGVVDTDEAWSKSANPAQFQEMAQAASA